MQYSPLIFSWSVVALGVTIFVAGVIFIHFLKKREEQ